MRNKLYQAVIELLHKPAGAQRSRECRIGEALVRNRLASTMEGAVRSGRLVAGEVAGDRPFLAPEPRHRPHELAQPKPVAPYRIVILSDPERAERVEGESKTAVVCSCLSS